MRTDTANANNEISRGVSHYSIRPVYAEHFRGPVSGNDNSFRTVPTLLRALADWMDQNDIQDPEFFNLVSHKSFTGNDDKSQETITIYYTKS